MSGFCGWFGPLNSNVRHEDSLESMASGLPSVLDEVSAASCGEGFGLSIKSHPKTGSFFQDEAIITAIEGYPSWKDADLARMARRLGHAQCLADAYRRYGIDLLQHLFGSFSIAVLDLQIGTALLAIDRLGVQPLCYALPGPEQPSILFGSTTDSIAGAFKEKAAIRQQSLYDYFYFVDRIPAPNTIYEGQNKFSPGECLVIAEGTARLHKYWRVPYRGGEEGSSIQAKEAELLTRLSSAVSTAVEGEAADKVGAYLSGGLDSSSVVGMLAELLNQPPNTFTVGFNEQGFDERHYARIAAKAFSTQHREFILAPEHTLEMIEKIFRFYDEPFANSSAIPSYFCAAHAKSHGIELLLAGDGGDELFAGNSRYLIDKRFEYYGQLPKLLRSHFVEPVLDRFDEANLRGLAGKAKRFVANSNKPTPERMAIHNLFAAVDPNEIFLSDFLEDIDPLAPVAHSISIYDSNETDNKIQKMMGFDLQITLADSDIRKVSRMCELAGVRVRYPFLDDDLVRFAASIPPSELLQEQKLRAFYKRALRNMIPNEIITKPKHGFGLPSYVQVRGYKPLRDFFLESLVDLRKRPYFRKSFIDRLERSLMGEEQLRYGGVVWDFAALEQWLQSRSYRPT